MPEYILDTDHLSYVQRNVPSVVDRLTRLGAADRVKTTVISVGELLRGVYALPEGRRRRELLELYTPHDRRNVRAGFDHIAGGRKVC